MENLKVDSMVSQWGLLMADHSDLKKVAEMGDSMDETKDILKADGKDSTMDAILADERALVMVAWMDMSWVEL